MASSNYVPAGSGLEVRPNEIKQLMRNPHNPLGGVAFSGFDKALGTASDWIAGVGPGIDALLGGHVTARAIANSSVSALMGPGGGYSTPGIGGGFGSGAYGPTTNTLKMLGTSMPGTAPGYPGSGGMPGMAPGYSGGGIAGGGMGGTNVGQFDSQINAMMSNNLMFLGLQSKMQQNSQTITMLTNMSSMDHQTKVTALRNIGK